LEVAPAAFGLTATGIAVELLPLLAEAGAGADVVVGAGAGFAAPVGARLGAAFVGEGEGFAGAAEACGAAAVVTDNVGWCAYMTETPACE
jgi:hypothetical protein